MASKITSKKTVEKQPVNPFEEFLSKYCSTETIFLLKNSFEFYHCKKNQRIFSEGDKVEGIFFINKGMAKIVSSCNKNEERILRVSNKGSLIGHRGLSSEFYPISAIALSDTDVTFLPIKLFTLLLKTNPDFSLFLINFISEELKNTEEQMKKMMHGEVLNKIAYIICCLIDTFGFDEKVPLKLKYTLARTDIANIAGTTYETVIRTIAQMDKTNLITIDGKSLIINKESAIRKLATNSKKTKIN